MPQHEDAAVLGYLDGRGVPRARLDERLRRLRSGARAALLPVPGSAEDRQLARWVAQVILTEELCRAEAKHRDLPVHRGLPVHRSPATVSAVATVELGSILAAAWANCAAVAAVFDRVTCDRVTFDRVTATVVGTAPDRPRAEPARWLLRHGLDGGAMYRLGPVSREELPVVIAAGLDDRPAGALFDVTDQIGRHTVLVEAYWPTGQPPDHQPALAPEQARSSARRAAFVRWIDAERAARVVTVTGLEHPGDPSQPDNHHKH